MPKLRAHASIIGTGRSLPERVMTNFDIEKLVDTNDEWIRTRTGISERRVIDKGVSASDLAVPAARKALKNAEMKPEELDLIIVASITPDMLMPCSACLLQAKLGARNAGAFDLSAACTGFVYALSAANGFIASGTAKNILVVGSECLSAFIDWTDRNTCILFGDGAGAAVVTADTGRGQILRTHLAADGHGGELICIPAGGSSLPPTKKTIEERQHFMKMRGREVFKFAVTTFQKEIQDAISSCGLEEKDVALIVPHQVNIRIIESAMRGLNIPLERVVINLNKYGNTSAASIPISLDEAVEEGRLKRGDIVLMVAFGGGLTWGSAVIRW